MNRRWISSSQISTGVTSWTRKPTSTRGTVTTSALSDYADVTQRAALKALGKRFMRGSEEPDPEAYRMQMHAIGCLDDTEISWMLTGWAILREEGAQVPDTPQGSRAAATEERPASDAQWKRIR